MTQEELKKLLNELRALPAETECLEFKEAKNTSHFGSSGKFVGKAKEEGRGKRKVEKE